MKENDTLPAPPPEIFIPVNESDMDRVSPIYQETEERDPQGKLNFMMEHARFTTFMESAKMGYDKPGDYFPFYIATYVEAMKYLVLSNKIDAHKAIAAMRKWYDLPYAREEFQRIRIDILNEQLHDVAIAAIHDVNLAAG